MSDVSAPCRCDQPTCRLCHPVQAAIIAGDITGNTSIIGGAIHDPGDTMPDQTEPVDVPGLGTALVILGSIIGLVTVGAIIDQEWGWRWAGLWLAAVFIVLGAMLRLCAGPSDNYPDATDHLQQP